MISSGLQKIYPHKKDFSLIHSFGITTIDVQSLAENFSIFDGRVIPNQNEPDTRFTPALPPLPYGCVGETAAFDSGIQDGATYRPDVPYLQTAPFDTTAGRDIRAVLQTLIDKSVLIRGDGTVGPKRLAYFNVYGANNITDADAARIGVYINQNEKQGVWVGTFWYPEFEHPNADGSLPAPSFVMSAASMHCHLITGWKTINDVVYLEDISWQGNNYAAAGLDYISTDIYNALLAQPYTGAFRTTKMPSGGAIPIGMTAWVDHVVAYVRSLFNV